MRRFAALERHWRRRRKNRVVLMVVEQDRRKTWDDEKEAAFIHRVKSQPTFSSGVT